MVLEGEEGRNESKGFGMVTTVGTTEGRTIAVFSQRAIRRDVSRCSGYEFEDVVAGLETADLFAPTRPDKALSLHRARRWLSRRTGQFVHVPSGATRRPIGREVDLFGCFLQKPVELLELDSVPDWRRWARFAFCVLEELWDVTIDEYRPLLRSLRQFDLVTCAFESSCAPLAEIIGRPVLHLPGAADFLRFGPRALNDDRPIDVYYMGRRRPDLHAALQKTLAARGGFYLHDTTTMPPIAADHRVHRDMLAALVNRAKLFMVDYGKVGHSDQSRGQIIWGPRHVEGMAGGAVQAGYAPESADYRAHFDWPEAVERLPQEPELAARAIARLLDDPADLARRRRVNLAHAARRHDWLHRWQLILDHFGLPQTEAMAGRHAALEALACTAEGRAVAA